MDRAAETMRSDNTQPVAKPRAIQSTIRIKPGLMSCPPYDKAALFFLLQPLKSSPGTFVLGIQPQRLLIVLDSLASVSLIFIDFRKPDIGHRELRIQLRVEFQDLNCRRDFSRYPPGFFPPAVSACLP